MSTKKTVSDSDTKKTVPDIESTAESTETTADTPTDTTPENKAQYEGVKTFVYIGPALPNGRLKSNTILSGTYTEITDYYKEAVALYPGVERLIVPVLRLAESREKVQKGGNLLHKYYQDVAAAIVPKGDEE